MDAAKEQRAVARVVRDPVERWRSGDYDAIHELVTDGVVIAPPDADGRVVGRDAFVGSFREYDAAVRTLAFEPDEPRVDPLGDAAVALCPFRVEYELEGVTYREGGEDEFVLLRGADDRWRIVWRRMRIHPDGADGS